MVLICDGRRLQAELPPHGVIAGLLRDVYDHMQRGTVLSSYSRQPRRTARRRHCGRVRCAEAASPVAVVAAAGAKAAATAAAAAAGTSGLR